MESRHSFSAIHLEDFNKLLEDYSSVVLPKLSDLDSARYNTIPATLAERKTKYEAADEKSASASTDPPALKKPELVTLVEWKLSHGTFRPSLKKLIESNTEDDVTICTVVGFAHFNPNLDRHITAPLKSLAELKGVGPATASLLLSVWDPERAPFFSDELFRWAHYEAKPGKGWDRVIKYTPKEYLELFAKMTELRERLHVTAVDAEKVAYVLGRRATGKSAENATESEQVAQTQAKRKDTAEDEPSITKKRSRKASTGKQPTYRTAKQKSEHSKGTRSSARLKSFS